MGSETPLGYVLEGERDRVEDWAGGVCLVVGRGKDHKMMETMTRFINSEHFGLGPDENAVAEGNEIIRARQLMERYTRRRTDGRYEVSLLWKEDEPVLLNNRALAEDRFRLKRSLPGILSCVRRFWS